MVDLILWRHAEAEDTSATGKDADRMLTARGLKDAAKMAKWLAKHLPADTVVLCSPARRCQQTVAALTALNQTEINTENFLSVDSNVERIAKAVNDYDNTKALVLVGHQPNLGLLIEQLLGMHHSAGVVKKCSVWWLRQRLVGHDLSYYIYAVQQIDS